MKHDFPCVHFSPSRERANVRVLNATRPFFLVRNNMRLTSSLDAQIATSRPKFGTNCDIKGKIWIWKPKSLPRGSHPNLQDQIQASRLKLILKCRPRSEPQDLCFHSKAFISIIKAKKIAFSVGRYSWRYFACRKQTRPDTQLPKSRAGEQGPHFRSPNHLGESSEVKKKIIKKIK